MTIQNKARIIAVIFFIFWLCVMIAGADFPPPVGFVWIIILDLLAAGLVYFRVPTYMEWSRLRKSLRIPRALLEGVAIGLLFGLIAMILPGTGEPSLPPSTWIDNTIWLVVLGLVGSINAGFVYLASAYMGSTYQSKVSR